MFGHLILREYTINKIDMSIIYRREGKIWQISTKDGIWLYVTSAREEGNKITLVGAELQGIHLSEIDTIWIKKSNASVIVGTISLGFLILGIPLFLLDS